MCMAPPCCGSNPSHQRPRIRHSASPSAATPWCSVMYAPAGPAVLAAKHPTVVALVQHLPHLPPLVPRGIGTNPFGCAKLMPCHQQQQHASLRQRYAPMMLVSAVRSWAGAPLCLSRQPASQRLNLPLASFTAARPPMPNGGACKTNRDQHACPGQQSQSNLTTVHVPLMGDLADATCSDASASSSLFVLPLAPSVPGRSPPVLIRLQVVWGTRTQINHTGADRRVHSLRHAFFFLLFFFGPCRPARFCRACRASHDTAQCGHHRIVGPANNADPEREGNAVSHKMPAYRLAQTVFLFCRTRSVGGRATGDFSPAHHCIVSMSCHVAEAVA